MGTKDRMRTSNSSLNLDSLSGLESRETFAGCSPLSSSSRDRFMINRCCVGREGALEVVHCLIDIARVSALTRDVASR